MRAGTKVCGVVVKDSICWYGCPSQRGGGKMALITCQSYVPMIEEYRKKERICLEYLRGVISWPISVIVNAD